MSDYWVAEAERRGDELASYGEWIDSNEDYIVERYVDTEPDHPEDFMSEFRYIEWLESLTIKDVPDDFISKLYEEYNESRGWDND